MDGQEEAGIGCYLAVSLPKRNTNSAFATWPQFQPHHSPVPLVPTLRIPAPSLRDPHAPCSPSSSSSPSLCAAPPALHCALSGKVRRRFASRESAGALASAARQMLLPTLLTYPEPESAPSPAPR